MEKLSWRIAGPQALCVQKMVDFFWNVGAPETEIDKLNDLGSLVNPMRLGSWIDMSVKGGMDGGWFFPVDMSLKVFVHCSLLLNYFKLAIEAADSGEATKKLLEWADKYNIVQVYSVGRDMGAAPPRQTELRLKLPGVDFNAQLAASIKI